MALALLLLACATAAYADLECDALDDVDAPELPACRADMASGYLADR